MRPVRVLVRHVHVHGWGWASLHLHRGTTRRHWIVIGLRVRPRERVGLSVIGAVRVGLLMLLLRSRMLQGATLSRRLRSRVKRYMGCLASRSRDIHVWRRRLRLCWRVRGHGTSVRGNRNVTWSRCCHPDIARIWLGRHRMCHGRAKSWGNWARR